VESYDVALAGIDIVYESSQIGLPGQTILFQNLTPGNYTVTVDAYDDVDPTAAGSNRIFTGSANATVVAGQVTTVTIQLEYVDGDLEIEIRPQEKKCLTRHKLKSKIFPLWHIMIMMSDRYLLPV